MTADTVRRCEVFRLPAAHPADVSGVMPLIASGSVRPNEIRAILGKTEGNGCVNDFTRAYAVSAFQQALAEPLGCTPVRSDIASRWSCPAAPKADCLRIFSSSPLPRRCPATRPSLAIGTAFTRPFRPEEIGRIAADRGNRPGGNRGDGPSRHHRAGGRPLCAGQMPAADRRSHRRCHIRAARPLHCRHLQIDGLFTRRLRPGRCPWPCRNSPPAHSTTMSFAAGSIFGRAAPAPPPASS